MEIATEPSRKKRLCVHKDYCHEVSKVKSGDWTYGNYADWEINPILFDLCTLIGMDAMKIKRPDIILCVYCLRDGK